jgi:hypothetical protein
VADLVAGRVYVAPLGTGPGGDGWAGIGETFGGFELQFPVADPAPFGRLAGLTMSITVDLSEATEALRWFHDLERTCYPRKHRRCHTCHPTWSRPLAVNGHEYHRRARARQGRNRR